MKSYKLNSSISTQVGAALLQPAICRSHSVVNVGRREMEKKVASRTTAGSSAGKSLDRQRDNGRGNGNGGSRFQKKREPVQWSKAGNDAGQQRKVTSQKTKAFDKRPRSRKDWTGRRDEVTQVHRAEFGSALPQGPKKMNLNHLINFTMAPREDTRGGRLGAWRGRNKWGIRHPRYNKEQFLQANCQFVVKATGDYTVQSVDPDKLVDWDLIEQVRIFSHEVPSCPICLYPPAAAKITRCGHIYCWPCILHYLALGDKSWRKCPICYEAVHTKDLKSVVAMETHMYTVGDIITMRLMKREKGSVLVRPHMPGREDGQSNQMYSLHDDTSRVCFAKLLIASSEEVGTHCDRARNEGTSEADDLECSFIQEAIDQLQARETEVTGIKKATAQATSLLQDLELASKEKEEDDDIHIQDNPVSTPSIVYASAFSDEEADPEADEDFKPKSPAFVIEEPAEALPRRSSSQKDEEEVPSRSSTPDIKERRESDDAEKMSDAKALNNGPDKNRAYYFYQAEDGQHLYMHSINIRCLILEYGSLDKCPPTVQARIVTIEHMSIDPNLRRRLNFLQHLPVTCEFATCELELKSPLLSKSTLQNFSGEILKRKKTRDRKARDEKRRERKIQAEENKKSGNYPGPRFSIESAAHFPSYSANAANSDTASVQPPDSPVSSSVGSPVGSSFDEDVIFGHISGGSQSSSSSAVAIQHQQQVDMATSPPSAVAGSWKSTGSSDLEQNSAFPSFAQMLRDGKANPQAWPKVVRPSSDGGDVAQLKVSQGRKVKVAGPDGSDDSENEDHVPVPQYREAFGDAIQAALDKAVTGKKTDSENPSPTTKKGKKGRKKQQLLFSTAGPRFK
ncbi:E3 ubiquitin-protein ligase RNF10-like [Amphiura filiformis]|uniref:E3 ubiquitin-protein ligase RNF10-like n=1 Tax=Amphiura filiformis TaxID=82378 RepID=UPI003B217CE5